MVPDADLEVLLLNSILSALYASDVPVTLPAAAVRVASLQSGWRVNPSVSELAQASQVSVSAVLSACKHASGAL